MQKHNIGAKPLSGSRNVPSNTLSVRVTFSSELIYHWVKNKSNISKFFRDISEQEYNKEARK